AMRSHHSWGWPPHGARAPTGGPPASAPGDRAPQGHVVWTVAVSAWGRLAVVLLAGLVSLAACSSDDDGASPTTQPAAATSTTAPTTAVTSDLDEAELPKTGVAVQRLDG